jgi:hypothetical protein
MTAITKLSLLPKTFSKSSRDADIKHFHWAFRPHNSCQIHHINIIVHWLLFTLSFRVKTSLSAIPKPKLVAAWRRLWIVIHLEPEQSRQTLRRYYTIDVLTDWGCVRFPGRHSMFSCSEWPVEANSRIVGRPWRMTYRLRLGCKKVRRGFCDGHCLPHLSVTSSILSWSRFSARIWKYLPEENSLSASSLTDSSVQKSYGQWRQSASVISPTSPCAATSRIMPTFISWSQSSKLATRRARLEGYIYN